MSKVNIALDATMLNELQLCPARFNYRFNMNKTTPQKAAPLDRGTVLHAGMEKYYLALKAGKSFDESVADCMSAIRFEAAKSQLDFMAIDTIIDVVESNLDHWRVADQRFQIVDVEKSFAYELFADEQVRIIMIGKIDLIISDDRYTNLPVDHKSFDRTFPTNRLSNQFINYCAALDSNYLLINKIGFQKTLSPEEKFKRIPLSYDHLIIDQWKTNTIEWVKYYLECVATNHWPMNFTSCDKYHRLCEFYDVCDSSGIEAKTFKLDSNFITAEPWDVSKALTEKS